MAGRNKTDDNISRLILKERSNNKFWGCRKLAQLLKEKYSIKISKSTVNKIVKDHGIYSKKGRKKDLSIYKKRHKDLAGLYIFKSFVDEIGLFDEIVTQLKDIFPKIRKERLKKILLYIS
ncbi:MAG: helix-turn-helix domain-containing protein, partial [Candidatus Omnitrophica bacterium]|nr:helix-turn-helix domain-containing protein [Candidatus Omnitrophota bacterium]